jgi:hypothetical protein
MEAILVVDQADNELVREGQKVDIKLQELPLETLHGAINEIANIDLKVTPQRLSVKSGGDLATVTDKATGAEHPANVSYQARVPVDDSQRQLLIGLRGQAKIHAQWQSLGQRFWRFITHTFNFRM